MSVWCLEYLTQFSKWRGAWEVIFFFCSSSNYIFFQFHFWFILEWQIFDLCTIVWINKLTIVNDYLFTSQRESRAVPDMDLFYYTFNYFIPIGIIEVRVTKTNSKYFNSIFHASAHKSGFLKTLFSREMHHQSSSSYSF